MKSETVPVNGLKITTMSEKLFMLLNVEQAIAVYLIEFLLTSIEPETSGATSLLGLQDKVFYCDRQLLNI